MDPNPYQSPAETPQGNAKPRIAGWHPLTFAFIGFAAGTAVAAPLVLSASRLDRLIVGAVLGGTSGAIIGLVYGLERRRMADSPPGQEGAESE